MAAITVKAVRQRIVAVIDAALSASGWRESRDPYDRFGQGGDGDNRLHLGYAVGIISSTPRAAVRQRQRASEGVEAETDVRVKWAYNLAALDQVTSYDAALDAGAAIRVAALSAHESADLHLVYAGDGQTVDADGWLIGEIRFVAVHLLALS